MNVTWQRRRLELKHPWTLARGTARFKDYCFVEIEEDGIIGYGEAAHNGRYGESVEAVEAFFEAGGQSQDGPASARAALDIARHDLGGKQRGVPVHALLGIVPRSLPPTSHSIGIDDLDTVRAKVDEAGEFEILKVKLGGDNDTEVMAAVRDVTDKLVRVDANEGWATKELALERIEWLADQGVELVEQPMPAGRLEEMAWLKKRSPLPLVADEDCIERKCIDQLVDAYDGINMKVMKAGGISHARGMITRARDLGLKTMLGCMIESSLGISAALHLAPLVDWVDLDGNLLITNDPFTGIEPVGGRLELPTAPGLGVEPRIAKGAAT